MSDNERLRQIAHDMALNAEFEAARRRRFVAPISDEEEEPAIWRLVEIRREIDELEQQLDPDLAVFVTDEELMDACLWKHASYSQIQNEYTIRRRIANLEQDLNAYLELLK